MRPVSSRSPMASTALAFCLVTAVFAPARAARADVDPAADKNARPALPPGPEPAPLPWQKHVEIGADIALVSRPASVDINGNSSGIRYLPAVGWGAHARWDVFRYVRFSAYVLKSSHELRLPQAALGFPATLSIEPVKTYSFGARLAPTWPFNDRARAWISAGIGWGRVASDRIDVTDATGSFQVRERAHSFAEIPLGIGAAFEVIPRWLSIEIEVTGSYIFGQEGELLRAAQAIDGAGRKRAIGPFPELDASFTQTLGLSLVL